MTGSGAETDVVPVSAEQAEVLLHRPDEFSERFGLTLVPGFLAFPEALPHTLQALRNGVAAEWSSYLIIVRDEVVGFGGFTGPPDDEGRVEIGYCIAPARRGRGLATAAARAWVERARAFGVCVITAHTLPAENPSTGVLRRLGFVRDGEATDPDEGPVWRWTLRIEP